MMLYPHSDSNGGDACLVCFMATAAVSTEDVPTEKGGVRRYGATEGVPAVRAASCRDGRLAPLTEACVQGSIKTLSNGGVKGAHDECLLHTASLTWLC